MTASSGGIINTGNIARQLEDGINSIINLEYENYEPEWSKYLEERASNKAYETMVAMARTGFANVKPEGTPIMFDGTQEAAPKIFNNITYGLGTIITEEAIDDSRYLDMMDFAATSLSDSIMATEEQVSANWFNNGYTTSLGWDGQPLFSANHLLIKGGTYSNVLPTPADLSEAAIEDMINILGRYTDDAGLPKRAIAESLHIPVELQFLACRILDSPLQSGTGNNDINALRTKGMLPKGTHICHYFDEPDQWFIKTNVRDGGVFFRRKAPTFSADNEFNTGDYKHKGITRFSVGHGDAKGYIANGLL